MRFLFLLLMVSFLTSCSTTVDFKIPSNRFHTPESSGRTLGGEVGIGYGSLQKYETAQIYNYYIFDDVEADFTDSISRSSGIAAYAQLGVLERLDLYYNTAHDSADVFGLKYQFLGKAKELGHKMAIMLGYGNGSESKSSTNLVSRSDSRDYQADLDYDAYEAEILYGYRQTKNLLYYVNLNYSLYDTVTKLSSSSYEDESIRGIVRTVNTLVGIEIQESKEMLSIRIEGGIGRSKWEDRYSKTFYPIGFFGVLKF
ncbi:hypothetical protein HBN50_09650 [Halobacteriovorax sp. GB3]|uniref:hypothetical protein n=1 Tax=Halobacteriovorax sp. GB3 TaxID=2719615 RepID=UPI00235DD342|nr:hypothetical protein [Halobacteriovorax sp. GB3]MDD0853362.1 hypothetical protein [Halobacteriovorax sp. GB3]